MAKDKDLQKGFLDILEDFQDMTKNMSNTELELFRRLISGEADSAEVENKQFYTYQKPNYEAKATKAIEWLSPFWNAKQEDDKLELCQFVERDGQVRHLTREQQREELRSYLYLLFTHFDPKKPDNRWKCYGPLWMMERLKLTGCLDVVLEALRQDGYFIHHFFFNIELPSALVYQLGWKQTEMLEKFIYEQGIIPESKPIVLTALVWTYLRHPELRLRVLAILTKFLNHCLEICKKGASSMNIELYALALATAHIKETMPLLCRLFTELEINTYFLMDGYHELERVMKDKTVEFYCKYDSLDGYLNDPEVIEEADAEDGKQLWSDNYDDEDDDEPYDFYDEDDGIYDTTEKAKRYTVHIELADAPEKVERTLQLPSNMTLTGFAKLIMLSFGRQDVPELYEFGDNDFRYLPNDDEYALEKEFWEIESTDYNTVGSMLPKKGNTATFDIKKGKKMLWHHIITLEKSGRYTPNSEVHLVLLNGHGNYPSQSIHSMTEYERRYQEGKLRKPNFNTVRKRIQEFEKENEPIL